MDREPNALGMLDLMVSPGFCVTEQKIVKCNAAAQALLLREGMEIAPLLATAVVTEMSAVGSLIIVALALNLLGITKLKIMNFVPAIFLPMLLCPLYDWIAAWLATLL